MTMKLVSTVTVGAGGASSIQFTSIPQTGTDLLLLVSGRSTNTSQAFEIRFNGSSASLSDRYLYGSGSAAASGTDSAIYGYATQSTDTASTFGNVQIYVPNYAGSTNKSLSVDSVTENNATAALQVLTAGLWANTAAITSLSLSGFTFAQYTTASLYTITKGSGGATVS